MANGAVWSETVYPTGADITFSADRLTAVCTGPSQAICRTNVPFSSGLYCFAIQFGGASGYLDSGCFTSESIVTGGESYPAVGIVVGDSGTIQYSAGGGSYATVGSLSSPATGQWWVWYIDTGTGTNSSGTAQFWVGLVDATEGLQGNWNGTAGANPLTGEGGIACAAMTDFVPATWFYSGNGTVVINGVASALPGGISAGNYQSLPTGTGDQLLEVTGVTAIVDESTAVTWTAYNGPVTGPLTYSLDDGAQTAPTGGDVSGNGGVFTIPPIDDQQIHSIAIQDSSNTSDTSGLLYFLAKASAPTCSAAFTS